MCATELPNALSPELALWVGRVGPSALTMLGYEIHDDLQPTDVGWLGSRGNRTDRSSPAFAESGHATWTRRIGRRFRAVAALL